MKPQGSNALPTTGDYTLDFPHLSSNLFPIQQGNCKDFFRTLAFPVA